MNRFLSFAYKYKLHHVLLWVAYFVFWVVPYAGTFPLVGLILATGIYFIFTAPSFYITSYYLIPKFLYKRHVAGFFIRWLVMLGLLTTGLGFGLYFYFNAINNTAFGQNFYTYFWIAFISISTMTGLLSGAKLLVDKYRTDRQAKAVEQQRLETELQYLKAQVNPHFLFNTINSVYILIKKDPDKAAETLITLSDLLRFQLYDCSEDFITIEQELNYISNYLALERIRKGDRVAVEFVVEETVRNFSIAPFLLIPFIENCFKHVSNGAKQDNQIKIHLAKRDTTFHAYFWNTTDHHTTHEVGGIGLNNVKRRLELLYPQRYVLEHRADEHTYEVNLTLTV